jgi:type III secretion protein J
MRWSLSFAPTRAPWRAGVLLSLALLLAGCNADLYSGLNERDANRMVAVLMAHGIQAEKTAAKDGTLTIRVPNDRFADAMTQLDAAGLPAQQHATMGDVFRGNGLVATPAQERAQMIYATGEELARTIGEIDGVLNARVHVVLPNNDPLQRNATPSSASVFVRYAPTADFARFIPQIKTLVADSIAGLDYNRVSVVAVPAAVTQAAEPAAHSFRFLGMDILVSSQHQAALVFALVGMLVAGLAVLTGFLWSRQRRGRTFAAAP